MGRGVAETLGLVVATADDAPFPDHDRADGNLSLSPGSLRFAKGFAHELFIHFHVAKVLNYSYLCTVI